MYFYGHLSEGMHSFRLVELAFTTAMKDAWRRHSQKHVQITCPQKANVMVLREHKVTKSQCAIQNDFFNFTQQSRKCNSYICTTKVKEEDFVNALRT